MDTAEETMLALLLWSVDASPSEYAQINSSREDALRLVRTFEFEIGEARRAELTERGKAALMAYRAGQMDGLTKKASAA